MTCPSPPVILKNKDLINKYCTLLSNPRCRIYVGGLGTGWEANKLNVQEAFSRFGTVRDVWTAREGGFAFVEMEDPEVVEYAIRSLDGSIIAGGQVSVRLGQRRQYRNKERSRSSSRDRSARRMEKSPNKLNLFPTRSRSNGKGSISR